MTNILVKFVYKFPRQCNKIIVKVIHFNLIIFYIICLFFSGEVNGLSMELLPQTQFTPLPEALCLIVSELTSNNNGMASLDKVLDRLRDTYYGIQQPSEQIVYETLGSLIKERKLYHTGTESQKLALNSA